MKLWFFNQNDRVSFRNAEQSILVAIFPLLIVLGNVTLWIGDSSLTVPIAAILAIFFSLLTLYTLFANREFSVQSTTAAFALLVASAASSGIIAQLDGTEVTLQRFGASMIPYVLGLFVMVAFLDMPKPFSIRRSLELAAFVLIALIFFSAANQLLSLALSGRSLALYNKSNIDIPLGGSNFLAMFLVFFSVVGWRWNKLLWIFLLVALILTISRFGFIFFAAATIMTELHMRGHRRFVYTATASCAFVLLGVALLAGNGVLDAMESVRSLQSFAARIELWMMAREIIANSPLFGAGPGGFTAALEGANWKRSEWGAHNLALTVWVEAGFFGVLMLCMAVFAFFRGEVVEVSEESDLLKLAVAWVLCFAMVENAIEVSSMTLLLCYMLALSKMRFAGSISR
jgi:O-antigen ligase